MSKRVVSITTIDNPFDPIDDFDKWNQYDVGKGYNTCSYLARLAKTSFDMSDLDNELEEERAIDSICYWNPMIYRKVVRQI